MPSATTVSTPAPTTHVRRSRVSRGALLLALIAVGATFLLISPDPDQTYPGDVAWRSFSLLREIKGLMSLGGIAPTARGVEIKSTALHFCSAAVLLLLSATFLPGAGRPPTLRPGLSGWAAGPALLAAWVALSYLSALWSGDAELSIGQATLYGFMVAWAVGLAGTLERPQTRTLLGGLTLLSAVGAGMGVWHYYERNPYHRPGFPIGNPTTLAASLMPAMLLAAARIAAEVEARLRPGAGRSVGGMRGAAEAVVAARWPLAAAAALVPLVWCFVLADSRGALLGLLAGVAAVVLLVSGRRVRLVAGLAVVVGLTVLAWRIYTTRFDPVMARGATVRFRMYMWEYASQMWLRRPVLGSGAGAFPRLSGVPAIRDQALDPGAFMGDWADHVHNELFETLVETGFVGGTAFVGGFLAALVAAYRLYAAAGSTPERWQFAGLFGALIALLTDLLGGVALRLPGVPAVLFTLIGATWAAERQRQADARRDANVARDERSTDAAPAAPAAPGRVRGAWLRAGVGTGALLAGVGLGWATAREWVGVRCEFRARDALAANRAPEALAQAQAAQPLLLDPVRKLFAAECEVRARLAIAEEAFEHWRRAATPGAGSDPGAALPPSRESASTRAGPRPAGPTSATVAGPAAPDAALRRGAIEACEAAYRAALRLDRRAPTLLRMPAAGARMAERLAALYEDADPAKAAEWWGLAQQAWRLQRIYAPFDAEALLALTHYPDSLAAHIGLLRDALRAETPGPQWHEALRRLSAEPTFAEELARFRAAAEPIDPRTDLGALVASMAPEVYRLIAAWRAQAGEWSAAAADAERAARLYEAMRVRFPVHYSIALAEQAEYLLRADPLQPARPIELLRTAIDCLPRIQPQQYDALVRPFRLRLVVCLLAAGDEAAAADVLRRSPAEAADVDGAIADHYVDGLVAPFARFPRDQRPPLQPWIDAALRRRPDHLRAWAWNTWLAAESGDPERVEQVLGRASAAGVAPAGIERIRRSLAAEFPGLDVDQRPEPTSRVARPQTPTATRPSPPESEPREPEPEPDGSEIDP